MHSSQDNPLLRACVLSSANHTLLHLRPPGIRAAAQVLLQKEGMGLEHVKMQQNLIFTEIQLFFFNKHSSIQLQAFG